jgi:tetratricopeptide (TPR) repeat protein
VAGEGLYERYKDALKRGHVAALRGRLDEALDAYAEASRIAPERATPHTAAGTALLRRKRPADALAYYEAASRLAPRDEAALLGRAQALVALDRRLEAADAYDSLAELRSGGGKLADAVDAARRSLELAEGRERRRTLERLIGRLRATRADDRARVALERALRVLEGPRIAAARPKPIDDDVLAAAIAAADVAAAREEQAAVDAPPAGEAGLDEASDDDARDGAATDDEAWEGDESLAVDAGLEAALAAVDDEPETAPDEPALAAPVVPGIFERDLPPGIELGQLARLAEEAVDARDPGVAIDRLLDLAAANRLYGTQDAAIDACYQGLSLRPDDVDLHLALVQLYDERGWRALASDKLGLLDRLVGLDEDAGAQARVDAARSARV